MSQLVSTTTARQRSPRRSIWLWRSCRRSTREASHEMDVTCLTVRKRPFVSAADAKGGGYADPEPGMAPQAQHRIAQRELRTPRLAHARGRRPHLGLQRDGTT